MLRTNRCRFEAPACPQTETDGSLTDHMSASRASIPKLLAVAGFRADPDPFSRGAGFSIWIADSTTPFGTTSHVVVHVGADATGGTPADIAAHLKAIPRQGLQASAIIERSSRLFERRAALQHECGVGRVFTRREFLAKALNLSVADGSEDTSAFVEPMLRARDASESAVPHLLRWLTADEAADRGSNLGVVTADAGIGKTTLARRLRARLRDYPNCVPVLIESSHWKRLTDSSEVSLWDVWRESLSRHDLGVIRIEEVFQTCVREGIIVPIFDGLDELCTVRGGQFQIDETLRALAELVEGGNGRVLITARRGYWDAIRNEDTEVQHQLFELQPFSKFQQDKFWESRFPTNFDARERAKRIAQSLRGEAYGDAQQARPADRPTANPAVLELIAAAAEQSSAVADPESTDGSEMALVRAEMERSPLRGVILYLCSRERSRQGLAATATTQMKVFAELAVEFPAVLTADEIEICAQMIPSEQTVPAGVFEDAEQRKNLYSGPHPLLTRTIDGDYAYRFDFLRDYLQSEWLAEKWDVRRVAEMVGRAENAAGLSPVMEYLADTLAKSERTDWRERLRAAREFATHGGHREAIGGLWHLAAAVEGRESPHADKAQRAQAIRALFGDVDGYKHIDFRGRFVSLDLSGTAFVECRFLGCVFVNCVFNSATRFENCSFVSEFRIENCRGADKIALTFDRPGLEMSPEARDTLARYQKGGALGRRLITADAIERAVHLALRKLYTGGRFVALDSENMNRGPLRDSPVRDEVWSELERTGVIEYHTISGLGPGRGVAVTAKARQDVKNFVDGRLLSGRVKETVDGVSRSLAD